MELEERRELVAEFLRRCVVYAEDSICRKRERGEMEEDIGKWESYRDFTQHAVSEVENGDLDDWLAIEEE
ncbi:MAG: hypothetical protein CMB67_05200 [Euryarchaeota archaeon]|nr:hypothetical protein [Euryarchaeota archaeon]